MLRPRADPLQEMLPSGRWAGSHGAETRLVSSAALEDSDLRDRATRLRPRIQVLYAENDVCHLWHPVNSTGADGRAPSKAHYRLKRPTRCKLGLVHVWATAFSPSGHPRGA